MKKSLSVFIVLFVIAILSGCIISKSPKENSVLMSPCVAKTFSIQTCIKPAKYAWYVDEVMIPEAMSNTYSYKFDEAIPSEHTVKVVAGNDKYTWNVHLCKATVFSDGTFLQSDWDYAVYTLGNGETQNYSQVLSGGNPNSYLYLENTVTTPYSSVLGVFLKKGATYDPSVSGPISSIDYSEDSIKFSGPDYGDGEASMLVIKQGDKLYFHNPYFKTQFSEWTSQSRCGLTSADFWLIDLDTLYFIETSNPDFSSTGELLTFGLSRANSADYHQGGYTITGGIDNWQVIVYSK
jgi:hypothetical protein